MKPVIGLLKKEVLISRYWYITYLIIIFLAIGGGSYFANRLDEPSLIIPGIVLFLPLHLFFMPIVVYYLLRMEGKTQLWLYNPQSSAKLLLAKLTIAFLFQLISQVILMGAGFLLIKYLLGQNVFEMIPKMNVFWVNIGLLATAFYMAIWTIFLWTVYHSLGRFPAWKNFRWLAVVLLIGGYNLIEMLFMKVKTLSNFIHIWTIDIHSIVEVGYETGKGWEIINETMPVPILPFLIYPIILLILFLAAGRLLDKKVEV